MIPLISKTDVIKCGTCEYWTGERKPIFDRHDMPKVNIIDGIGDCENQESRFCGQPRPQGLKCKAFTKWPELF